MPDNTPTPPPGAVPPKPAEAAKVQPKKETVRINLPPKPTSAPTIKLPTLAPGAPPPSMAATSAAAPAAPSAPRAAPVSAPAAAPPSSRAPAAAPKPGPAPAAARPMPVVERGLTALDTGLAIGATVATLAGLAALVYLKFFFPDNAP